MIICSNHISFFDPVAIGLGIKRQICFMAKSEFFTDCGIFVRAFLKACGVFSVKRGSSDIRSVNYAAKLLADSKAVGIFPQGKIVKDGSFEPKAGAALLAVKNHVPVLPVFVWTDGKIRPFSTVTVTFGEVIIPPDDHSLRAARQLTQTIKERINTIGEAKN